MDVAQPAFAARREHDGAGSGLAELESVQVSVAREHTGGRRRSQEAAPGRDRLRVRRRRRRDRREVEEAERASRPSRSPLERVSRFVGAMVIAVAVIWLGLITALAVLVGATSPTGVVVYVGALLAGLVAVGFGVLVRRA